MTTEPPPAYARLSAHRLVSPGRSVVFHALWLPADILWMVGAEFRTPQEMADAGWVYDRPLAGPSDGMKWWHAAHRLGDLQHHGEHSREIPLAVKEGRIEQQVPPQGGTPADRAAGPHAPATGIGGPDGTTAAIPPFDPPAPIAEPSGLPVASRPSRRSWVSFLRGLCP